MIYSLRHARAATVLPRLEVLGRRLRVELIRPRDTFIERSGLVSPEELPAQEVVDERVYDLSEFSESEYYLKYFLLHDRRLRLLDPLNVFVSHPEGYASLFEGPSPLYVVTVLYQPVPVRSFDEMHFVFPRSAVMKGEFEYYDELEKHVFSHRLMPEPRLESLRRDGERVVVEITLKDGDRRDCEIVLSSSALRLTAEPVEIRAGRGAWSGPYFGAGAVDVSVGYPHKTIETKRFELVP